MGKDDKKPSTGGAADRISELPDCLLHLILSFIPTLNAVRMSLVSKRWRNIWFGIPVLNFQQSDFYTQDSRESNEIDFFVKFMNKCLNLHLRRRCDNKATNNITVLKLDMDYRPCGGNTIDAWLNFALEANVKELDLGICPNFDDCAGIDHRYYSLPKSLLNNKCFTVLKLEGFRLKASSFLIISLPSLTSLSLSSVNFDDKYTTLQNLLSGCPIIEYLHLSSCGSMSSVDLTVCGALKGVHLGEVGQCSDKWLEHTVSGLPLLEKLSLAYCFDLDKFEIRSESLKSFCFVDVEDNADLPGVGVILCTPNLVCFSYYGNVSNLFLISCCSNLLQVSVQLGSYHENDTTAWFGDLLLFLLILECSTTLTLYFSSGNDLLFPKDMRKTCIPPLPDLKHLKVEIGNDFSINEEELMEALHWCAPSVETLEINKRKNTGMVWF